MALGQIRSRPCPSGPPLGPRFVSRTARGRDPLSPHVLRPGPPEVAHVVIVAICPTDFHARVLQDPLSPHVLRPGPPEAAYVVIVAICPTDFLKMALGQFRLFKQALEDSDSEDGYSPSPNLENGSVAPPRPPLPEKHSEMLAAVEALRALDPNFSETLENMLDVIRDNLQDSSGDSVFEERLQKLDVENSPKWELATYDGPLSRLNVHVEWYLNHPEEIELREQEASQKNLEGLPELVEEEDEAAAHATVTKTLRWVAHLRDRDVQLLDSIVKQDMTILNNVADIFKVEEDAEIASIVAETKRELEIVKAAKLANRQPWPNLMTRDPLLDTWEVLELPPKKENPLHNRVVIRNHHSIFTEALDADGFDFKNYELNKTEDDDNGNQNLPIDSAVLSRLRVTQVVHGFARQQTFKGKKDRFVAVLIVGDGNGFGKHKE
ncbi:hypothetical protein B0H11DRAFT_2214281 [Mycena galericulata]|nr:hypothetical protein B0H11DRAFT_2214281 [Mycena galericulata]